MGGAGLWEEGEEFSEDDEVAEEEAGPSNTSSSESETRGPHADAELGETVKEEAESEREGAWLV